MFSMDMTICELYMLYCLLGGIFLGVFIILISYKFIKISIIQI